MCSCARVRACVLCVCVCACTCASVCACAVVCAAPLFVFVCQLILSRIPSPYVVQSDVIIGLALVCALLLACFAAASRLGLDERARVCVHLLQS